MSPAERRFVQIADALREPNAWTDNEWLCRPDLVAAEKLLLLRANMDPGHCHPFPFPHNREELIHVILGRDEPWGGTPLPHPAPGGEGACPRRPRARHL